MLLPNLFVQGIVDRPFVLECFQNLLGKCGADVEALAVALKRLHAFQHGLPVLVLADGVMGVDANELSFFFKILERCAGLTSAQKGT